MHVKCKLCTHLNLHDERKYEWRVRVVFCVNTETLANTQKDTRTSTGCRCWCCCCGLLSGCARVSCVGCFFSLLFTAVEPLLLFAECRLNCIRTSHSLVDDGEGVRGYLIINFNKLYPLQSWRWWRRVVIASTARQPAKSILLHTCVVALCAVEWSGECVLRVGDRPVLCCSRARARCTALRIILYIKHIHTTGHGTHSSCCWGTP